MTNVEMMELLLNNSKLVKELLMYLSDRQRSRICKGLESWFFFDELENEIHTLDIWSIFQITPNRNDYMDIFEDDLIVDVEFEKWFEDTFMRAVKLKKIINKI